MLDGILSIQKAMRKIKMPYILHKKDGMFIPIITINESAKEDFKKLMDWSEEDFKFHTTPVFFFTIF